jgi:hypothetical protein
MEFWPDPTHRLTQAYDVSFTQMGNFKCRLGIEIPPTLCSAETPNDVRSKLRVVLTWPLLTTCNNPKQRNIFLSMTSEFKCAQHCRFILLHTTYSLTGPRAQTPAYAKFGLNYIHDYCDSSAHWGET